MKNFTIENETNNITVHGSAKEAEAFPDSERAAQSVHTVTISVNIASYFSREFGDTDFVMGCQIRISPLFKTISSALAAHGIGNTGYHHPA